MRGFFVLLLLSNLGFFAWQYYEAKGADEAVDVYRNIFIVNNGLTLLSELPKEKRPALLEGVEPIDEPVVGETELVGGEAPNNLASDEAPVETVATELEAPTCFQVGGIEDEATLSTLMKRMERYGIEVVEKWKHQISEDNYWVFLPAYRNRRKANEAAEILSKRRVKDFFVVRSGEHENAISLGVFSNKERADKRYEEIVSLNARLRKPEIEIMQLPATRYQLSIRIQDGEKLKTVAAELKKMKLDSMTEISCK